MKYLVFTCFFLAVVIVETRAQAPITPQQKNPVTTQKIPSGTTPVNNKLITYSWSDTAVNYRVTFRGEIGVGQDDLRTDDSELQVNVVMRNGLVVPLICDGTGVITNSSSPSERVFHMSIRGESEYVTDLNIGHVEIIHLRKGLRTTATSVERIRYNNYQPDEWDFLNINLTGTITYTPPNGGPEREIVRREVLNRRINQKMSYGVWSSGPVSGRLDPPEQIRGAEGRVAARVLTGPDGMKPDPEIASIVVQVSGGQLKYDLGRYVGLEPYSFQNYDALAKMEGSTIWRGIGIAGIVYKYGNHGMFERDDWDVKGFMIDFFPDILSAKRICFRKFSHFLLNHNISLVRMNGDGDGMKKWAPYF